jgi:DNA-binding NtrC family response regulator
MSDVVLKCLLVDDDESMLEILSRTVEMLGFRPITACDGDEGYSAFCEQHPDLVLSDIHMPNRNGLLLLHDIREIAPEIPVILITGFWHYKAAVNAEADKPDAYLEKPFTIDALKDTIQRVVSSYRTAHPS